VCVHIYMYFVHIFREEDGLYVIDFLEFVGEYSYVNHRVRECVCISICIMCTFLVWNSADI